MATIYPIRDRIKVLPLLPQDKSKGGIIIPDAAKDRPIEGLVLAVGPGGLADDGSVIPMTCREGDVVVFGKFAGIHIPDAELELDVVLMREEEVLGRKVREELPAVLPNDPRVQRARDDAAEAEAQAELALAREQLRA